MEHIEKFVKAIASCACGLAGFLFGQLDGLLLALITFICLDYVSGILVGAVQHKLNSQISFSGLAKKALILIVVAVAHVIDTQILGGTNSVFRSAACGLYIANEGMSIIENAGKLGLPMPKKLREILEQLREKEEGEVSDKTVSPGQHDTNI